MKLALALLWLLLAGLAKSHAVGSYDEKLDREPAYRDVRRMMAEKDYAAAIPLLLRLDRDYPRNAELLNLLGFTHRKLKHYQEAKRFYDHSLTVNPEYLPALEYQGMWYIEMGDMPAAEGNLRKLKGICSACEETRDLEEALQAARAAAARPQGGSNPATPQTR